MALSKQIGTSVAVSFAVILGLLLLQAGWWIVFQLTSAEQQNRQFLAHLDHQREIATHVLPLLEDGKSLAPAHRKWLLETFPLLDFGQGAAAQLGPPALRAEVVQEVKQRHARLVRMFVAEGIFFVLLILLGATMLWRTIAFGMALARQQRNFVQAVTHELKSPLAAIRLAAETMQLRQLAPERQQVYLRAIGQDVDRLENLISNMLAVARFEAGQALLQVQPMDLAALIKSIMEGPYVQALCHNHRLVLHLPQTPQLVAIDPHAWTTIVHNIVSNAVKYSEPGSTLQVHVRVDGAHSFLISFQDEGIGLAASDTDRIFERFYRVGDELIRHTAGSGLGLFLVRALVEQHGGKITAESAGLGMGATIHIWLPKGKV